MSGSFFDRNIVGTSFAEVVCNGFRTFAYITGKSAVSTDAGDSQLIK
jgi:hypothetical protein